MLLLLFLMGVLTFWEIYLKKTWGCTWGHDYRFLWTHTETGVIQFVLRMQQKPPAVYWRTLITAGYVCVPWWDIYIYTLECKSLHPHGFWMETVMRLRMNRDCYDTMIWSYAGSSVPLFLLFQKQGMGSFLIHAPKTAKTWLEMIINAYKLFINEKIFISHSEFRTNV